MRFSFHATAFALSFAICSFTASPAFALDNQKIEQITGIKGSYKKDEGVFKITVPRSDISVVVDGWKIKPFMGLTSWAGFSSGGDQEAMIMGDIVLFQDEVNPAMKAALQSGLEVTALHNHFFFDEPRVYFMHIGGEGSAESLASGFKSILNAIAKVRSEHKTLSNRFIASTQPVKDSISPNGLNDVFGVTGQSQDGMYKAIFGTQVKMPCGCSAGKEMGINTWAAFAGTDNQAIVDGDFAVRESDLQTVLKSLSQSGINIVAIHHHMLQENPRIIFLHYWGHGRAIELAKSIKKALDSQKPEA